MHKSNYYSKPIKDSFKMDLININLDLLSPLMKNGCSVMEYQHEFRFREPSFLDNGFDYDQYKTEFNYAQT